jgi:HNH endonuclease
MVRYDPIEWKEQIEKVLNETWSMREAASKLNIHWNSFIKLVKELGLTPKPLSERIKYKRIHNFGRGIPLIEIIEGKHPQYNTFALKNRLLKAKLLERKCDNCKLEKWLGEDIPLEMHHKDGVSYNHKLENLQLLCPNCHTLTDTYRSKNSKRAKENK